MEIQFINLGCSSSQSIYPLIGNKRTVLEQIDQKKKKKKTEEEEEEEEAEEEEELN